MKRNIVALSAALVAAFLLASPSSEQTYPGFNPPLVPITAFGAKCDGTTDDTTAFQTALTAAQTAGGGTLYIPAATCVVGSSPLTYSGNNLHVTGTGPASVLKKTTTTGDLFQLTGASAQNIDVGHLTISAPTNATAGVLLNFTGINSGAGPFFIHDLEITGGWDLVYFHGGGQTFVTDNYFALFKDNGLHYGVSYSGNAFVSGLSIATSSNSGVGLYLENGDGFTLNNINIFGNNIAVYMHPQATTGYVRNVFGTNIFGDSSTSTGWVLDGSNSGAFLERINLTNAWAGGNGADGFLLNSVKELSCVNCRAITNSAQGFHLNGGCTGIKLTDGTAEGNSSGASGTNDGIRLDGTNSHVQIIGMRSGPSSSEFITNSQKYGINLNSGATSNSVIQSSDLSGNITSAINGTWSGNNNLIVGNIGIANSTTAAVGVGASPATITAGAQPETHYINQNATNSATISKNGVQMMNLINPATFYIIELQPNESYVVTWTTTQPTFSRDIH